MNKYVVVDLEMCTVPGKCKEYPYRNETIQIGAVLLDEKYEVIDKYSTYVKPEFGYLSSSIEHLTGISEWHISSAPYFKEALDGFAAWLPDEELEFVEWSDTDHIQIQREMAIKNIRNDKVQAIVNSSIDCQRLFSDRLSESKQYNLMNALIAADIVPEGREHDGLDDACNTASLFTKLMKNEVLTLNPIYEVARKEEVNHLGFSLGNLFAGINVAALPA